MVNVEYTFAKDGSVIEIPMVLAEEEQKIWLLSTGDVSAASGQKIGPLPGEQPPGESMWNTKRILREICRQDSIQSIWRRRSKLFRFRYSYSGVQLRNLCDV